MPMREVDDRGARLALFGEQVRAGIEFRGKAEVEIEEAAQPVRDVAG